MLLQMLWWSPSMLSHIYTPFWKLTSPVLRCPSFVFKLQWPFLVTPLCIESKKCPSKEDLIFRLKFLGPLFVCNTLDIVPHSSFVRVHLFSHVPSMIPPSFPFPWIPNSMLSLPIRSPLDPGLVPLLQSSPISHFYSFSILIIVFDTIQLGS